MSVLRSGGLLAALVVVLAVAAACGGASTSPGASASVTTGATPAPASQSTEPSDVPDGSGGTASNPPIADGAFTSGKLHIEVSGDVTATVDLPLQGGLSFTQAGSTVLSYADPATGDGGGVAISPDGNVITLSTAAVSTAGASVQATGCRITVTQSDASRLAGTVDCPGLPGVVAATAKNVTVNLRGTFEASR
jgi:hypothetical protein